MRPWLLLLLLLLALCCSSLQQEDRLQVDRLQEDRLQVDRLQEDRLPEDRLQEDRLQVDRLQEDRLPEDRLPEDRLQEDRLPEDRLQEDRLPEDRLPEDRLQEDRLQEDRPALQLNPDLEDGVPEVPANRSVGTYRRLRRADRLPPAPPPTFSDSGSLRWRPWPGSLPNNSVAIYNKYAGRFDYVCRYQCNAGFYTPGKGSSCHYAFGDKEHRESSFDILVNEDDFEILEWKDGSYGSVPQHAVRTCPGHDVYVGKNKYGLGKVHCVHKAFFLPWEGKEYWYKSYEVLTISKDVESEVISDVKYNINGAVIFQHPPETIHTSTSTNYKCDSVSKTVALSKAVTDERTWNIGFSLTAGIKKTFTGGIPGTASGSIEISLEATFQVSGGITTTETLSHSVSITLKVPPNHSCKAKMVGYKYKVDIPFSARLSRTYRNQHTAWTSVSGVYKSVQMGEIQTVVDRCQPVADAKPCPSRPSEDG